MRVVDVICLANSIKLGGRCVAALRSDGKGWVRPVAPTADGSLRQKHYTLNDGSEARILDVVRIELSEPRPEPHQPENWTVGDRPWQLIRRPASPRELRLILRSLEGGPAIFGDCSDRLSYSYLCENPTEKSLCLVKPESVQWQITTSFTGKRQTRSFFSLGGRWHNLVVTDPVWTARLGHLDIGSYGVDAIPFGAENALLFTVSLGEPLPEREQCFKLIAGVVILPNTLPSTH